MDENEQKTDLSLVSIDELIKEIESRSETFICAYELPDEKDKKGDFNTYYGKGAWKDACGFAAILLNDCLNNWNGELKTLQRIHDEGIL